MKTRITDTGVMIWLSARDTRRWATRPNAAWPCSELSDHRIFAAFDDNGLYDLTIDGRYGDCDANELNAIVCDHLRSRLPADHPCYFVVIGQFIASR